MAFLRRFLTGQSKPAPKPTANTPDPNVVVTVIGAGSSLSGVLVVHGGARIDGSFEGSLVVNGTLAIGTQARVICQEIRAQTALVAGTVKGNITAERVEILATGKIFGNLLTDSLATEEGGYVRGEVTFSNPPAIEDEYDLTEDDAEDELDESELFAEDETTDEETQ